MMGLTGIHLKLKLRSSSRKIWLLQRYVHNQHDLFTFSIKSLILSFKVCLEAGQFHVTDLLSLLFLLHIFYNLFCPTRFCCIFPSSVVPTEIHISFTLCVLTSFIIFIIYFSFHVTDMVFSLPSSGALWGFLLHQPFQFSFHFLPKINPVVPEISPLTPCKYCIKTLLLVIELM